ncbi:MAG: TadE/TadG family type IV pilus assembly protein [Geminicoccaceae bacterium]
MGAREYHPQPFASLRRLALAQAGNAALEFALIAPVLLFVLLGMMEYGRFFYAQSTLQSATAVALRQAAIDTGLDENAARTLFAAELVGLDPHGLTGFSLSRTTEPGTSLQRITLRATFAFQPVVAFVFSRPVSVEASALGVGGSG